MELNTSTVFARAILPSKLDKKLESSESKQPYDVIEAILDDCIHFSGRRAFWFGVLYYSLRVTLIVLSACAAAKGIQRLDTHVAVLSLLVAIGTTIDTWLQPGVHYKAHYTYNDKFRALKSDLYFIQRDDASSLKTLNESWKALDDEYRKTVLPI
jgi:hypothetical protein